MRERNLFVPVAGIPQTSSPLTAFRWWNLPVIGQGMEPWHMWEWGGFWWMSFFMIIFWIVIAFGIYLLVRASMPRRRVYPREAYVGAESDRALAIARERLARGEITVDEFERIKKSLSEQR